MEDREKVSVQNRAALDLVAETYKVEIEESEREIAEVVSGVLESMGVYPGSSLIELGSGSGHLSACLAMKGYKTTLLFFSEVALEKARLTYANYGLEGEFLSGDLMERPYIEGVYDIAWNSAVIEHFGAGELYAIVRNAIELAIKGILFIMPNEQSISYNLMRARLMSQGKWKYGNECLRQDFETILQDFGLAQVRATFVSVPEMSKNHMHVANNGEGDLDELYGLLLKNNLLPIQESYLVAYSALKTGADISIGADKEYSNNTDLKTRAFDLLAENYDLTKKNEELRGIVSEKEREMTATIGEKEKLNSMLADIQKEKTIVEDKLMSENLINATALQRCNELINSKLFKLTYFLYRTKYQGIKGNRIEQKKYLKWILSKCMGREDNTDRRYNPLFSVINILNGTGQEDGAMDAVTSHASLERHLEAERKRFLSKGENKKEVKEIQKLIEKRQYKGILVYPHVVYWEPLQTPQQLLRAFAKSGWLCFFCEHPNIKDAFREEEENLIIVHEKELIKALGNHEVTILLTWLGSIPFVECIKNKKIWYHVLDKLDLFPYYDEYYDEMHQKYVGIANVVSYVASPLKACLLRRNNAVYLPNGVNPSEFLNIHDNYVPNDMKKIIETGHKIIGYYGYIAEWMDYDMVKAAALARPEYEFVFIGKEIYDTSKIQGISNIHLLGLKPYKELSDYAKFFDVATIPFVINEKMDCVSPIKFYEYCALGLPVVTSKMKEMEKVICDFVACVDGIEEFLIYIDRFSQNCVKKLAEEKGVLIAEQNTWLARAKHMEEEF